MHCSVGDEDGRTESANAALVARLEVTEVRLSDTERQRAALAAKLEAAVSAAAAERAEARDPFKVPRPKNAFRDVPENLSRVDGAMRTPPGNNTACSYNIAHDDG